MSTKGGRVAVTREEGPDGPLTRALLARGLQPVACPVIAHFPSPDLAPLWRAAAELERYDWVMVSSARAVEALAHCRAPLPLPASRRPRWAAVGTATAAALERWGIHGAVVPAGAGAPALLAALRDADTWKARRVLLPRADQGRPELAEGLQALGARVTEVVAYRTQARPPKAIRAAWHAAAPDGVILASPSAASALVRAVGAPALQALKAVVAIGTTTADALRDLAISPCIATSPEFAATAELCAQLLGVLPTPSCP